MAQRDVGCSKVGPSAVVLAGSLTNPIGHATQTVLDLRRWRRVIHSVFYGIFTVSCSHRKLSKCDSRVGGRYYPAGGDAIHAEGLQVQRLALVMGLAVKRQGAFARAEQNGDMRWFSRTCAAASGFGRGTELVFQAHRRLP